MDSIVSSAMEAICSRGPGGIAVEDLWPRLDDPIASAGLDLCEGVKAAIWGRLIGVPGLRFHGRDGRVLPPGSPSVRSVEGAGVLRIIADEHLRDSFLGIYDLKASDAEISAIQRRTLERLAIAGTDGITQSELAKEFNVKGNNIFYFLRQLECKQLITRQSTIIRTKEVGAEGDNDTRNSSIVNTNLLHLHRYSKHLNLNSQQRLEIIRPDASENNDNAGESPLTGGCDSGYCAKEEVLVKDYLPAMKAVCDKLEEAGKKVLVVSDIKLALGYRKTPGHRAWRNICNRLKEARLVEEFSAEVDKKVVRCLRLLKSFDPKDFQPKALVRGSDEIDAEQLIKRGKRGQICDQLVELPIEHQIYDLIDAEGHKGLTYSEVCRRLGLDGKKNYPRLLNMRSRFGLHLQSETHNKSMLYRLWTSGNFNHGSSAIIPNKCGSILGTKQLSTRSGEDSILNDQSSPSVTLLASDIKNELESTEESGKVQIEMEGPSKNSGQDEDYEAVVNEESSQNTFDHVHKMAGIDHEARTTTINPATELNESLGSSHCASLTVSKPRSDMIYPCLKETALGALREQRILERLQEQKFVLVAELCKWLEGLEKDTTTKMAKKTLTHMLEKLKQQQLCKCVQVSVPVVTNCGRSRTTVVVLHPSVGSLSSELLAQIHERLRNFDAQGRQGLARSVNHPVSVLTDVKRPVNHHRVLDSQIVTEAMRANGFVPAKMIRAKLLHIFLWDFLNNLPDWHDALSSGKHSYDPKNPNSTCKLFALDDAVNAMPLELFLQVVGYAQQSEFLVENCRSRLTLGELPAQEYRRLMDAQAKGRLALVVHVLRRLKLIQLVTGGDEGETNLVSHAVLADAMELKPYIEEPVSRGLPSSIISSFDLRPRIRHDFILSNRDAVDAYWKTLEYCYAAADPTTASHAFPGSSVPGVFSSRNWASVRVMSAEQRIELLKRMENYDSNKKISFEQCVKISRDLNLTLEQVLRVSHDKKRSRLRGFLGDSKPRGPKTGKYVPSVRKRKRSPEHMFEDTVREMSKMGPPDTPDGYEIDMGKKTHHHPSIEENGIQLESSDGEIEEFGAKKEDGENSAFISQCAISRLRPMRRKKFLWTDKLDRQLVIQYAKYRAVLGAKFHRVDWASLADLPAPPDTCRRRMAALNSNLNVRKAVMKLCNVLGERYAKYLGMMREEELSCQEQTVHTQDGCSQPNLLPHTSTSKSNFQELYWGDSEDQLTNMAINEILQLKKTAKFNKAISNHEKEWTDIPVLDEMKLDTQACAAEEEHCFDSSSNPGARIENHTDICHRDSGMFFGTGRNRPSSRRLPEKFLKFLDGRGISPNEQVRKSPVAATAVELLKLVFLNTSTAPDVPRLLAETLQRFSERELLVAFNYLREKNFMVIGQGSHPFVLSQKFWQSASSSPFPVDTGKRATSFSSWLQKQEQYLQEDGVSLYADLHCGDIFHLFALLSSEEFSISPFMPLDGIGETEEQVTLKRKICRDKNGYENEFKRPKTLCFREGDCPRREKGFPGLKVSLNREKISRTGTVKFFKDDGKDKVSLHCDGNLQPDSSSAPCTIDDSYLSLFPQCHKHCSTTSGGGVHDDSIWDAMVKYAETTALRLGQKQVSHLQPDLFKSVYAAINQAGEQGLSMEQIPQVMNIPGENLAETVIDALQVFGLIVKINAYDCVHAVAAHHKSKYFLYSVSGHLRDLNTEARNNRSSQEHHGRASNIQTEITTNLCDGHKVTILNLPERDTSSCNEAPVSGVDLRSKISATEGAEDETIKCPTFRSSQENHEWASNIQTETTTNLCDGHKVTILNLPERDTSSCNEAPVNEVDLRSKTSATEGAKDEIIKCPTFAPLPILPWINGDGSMDTIMYKGLTRRIVGTVMQNPGISEDDLIRRMEVLNPQSCRKLLELLILDNHLTKRKMHQTTCSSAPAMLQGLLGNKFMKPKLVFRNHFFANPMSTHLL